MEAEIIYTFIGLAYLLFWPPSPHDDRREK
jgi:hypothetical protein